MVMVRDETVIGADVDRTIPCKHLSPTGHNARIGDSLHFDGPLLPAHLRAGSLYLMQVGYLGEHIAAASRRHPTS
jgi:hypothetical protein